MGGGERIKAFSLGLRNTRASCPKRKAREARHKGKDVWVNVGRLIPKRTINELSWKELLV